MRAPAPHGRILLLDYCCDLPFPSVSAAFVFRVTIRGESVQSVPDRPRNPLLTVVYNGITCVSPISSQYSVPEPAGDRQHLRGRPRPGWLPDCKSRRNLRGRRDSRRHIASSPSARVAVLTAPPAGTTNDQEVTGASPKETGKGSPGSSREWDQPFERSAARIGEDDYTADASSAHQLWKSGNGIFDRPKPGGETHPENRPAVKPARNHRRPLSLTVVVALGSCLSRLASEESAHNPKASTMSARRAEPVGSASPLRQSEARQVFKNVPRWSSSNAWRSSSCVFITIGPYQATGSPSGLPETKQKSDSLLARLHGDFVASIEQDE